MRCLTMLMCTPLVLLSIGCEKYALDRQMEELCEKDGGAKVYETVRLPARAFDVTGRPATANSIDRGAGLFTQDVGDDYTIEHKTTVIKDGNPFSGVIAEGRLLRSHTIIRRNSDGRVLGESVAYGRTGGDLTLGHPSQSHCPKPDQTKPSVERAVFTKEQ